MGRDTGVWLEGAGKCRHLHQRVTPYLVGEDLHQDLVFPQLVPHEKLVLGAQSHVLADRDHSVVSENCIYLPTEEPDEACLLKSGREDHGDIRCPSLLVPFLPQEWGLGLPAMAKQGKDQCTSRRAGALPPKRFHLPHYILSLLGNSGLYSRVFNPGNAHPLKLATNLTHSTPDNNLVKMTYASDTVLMLSDFTNYKDKIILG